MRVRAFPNRLHLHTHVFSSSRPRRSMRAIADTSCTLQRAVRSKANPRASHVLQCGSDKFDEVRRRGSVGGGARDERHTTNDRLWCEREQRNIRPRRISEFAGVERNAETFCDERSHGERIDALKGYAWFESGAAREREKAPRHH